MRKLFKEGLLLHVLTRLFVVISLSKHTEDNLRDRGISIREVETAIRRGARFVQKPNKTVADYGHIRVVYVMQENKCHVITVHFR